MNRPQLMISTASVGDALGAITEFCTPEEARDALRDFTPTSSFPKESMAPHGYQGGEVTDDTQMTLLTMQAITHARHEDAPYVATQQRLFRQWEHNQPRDIGLQTRRALRNGSEQAWQESSFTSAGNGGLMRTHGVSAMLHGSALLESICWSASNYAEGKRNDDVSAVLIEHLPARGTGE